MSSHTLSIFKFYELQIGQPEVEEVSLKVRAMKQNFFMRVSGNGLFSFT